MSSTAVQRAFWPRTLTDRRNDITTIKAPPGPEGLTSADVISEMPGMIDLVVKAFDEIRRVRFTVPTLRNPGWLVPTIQRAGHLLTLPQDWDREGAAPIDSTAIQAAIDILAQFMNANSSLPQWTPTQGSGVQLDWHESGIDLEIAFEPGELVGHAVYTDRREDPAAEWDGPPEEHLEDLRRVFRERLVS